MTRVRILSETLLRWMLAVYLSLWVVATHWPKPSVPRVPGGDKTLHFVGFFIAGWLLQLILPNRLVPRVLGVLALMVFAAFDELTQPWFGRSCDVFDGVADTAGAIAATLGVSAMAVFRNRMNHKEL